MVCKLGVKVEIDSYFPQNRLYWAGSTASFSGRLQTNGILMIAGTFFFEVA